MASFTGVGDNVVLSVPDKNEDILISISGTYNMVIELQRKVGEGVWDTLRTYSTADATVSEHYTTSNTGETTRLIVTTDTSGTATATLTDASDKVLHRFGGIGLPDILQVRQSGIVARKALVDLTAATYSAAAIQALANRTLFLNLAGGIDITLPAATGSGDRYDFIVTTATTDGYVLDAATGGADFNGTILGKADAVATTTEYTAGATDNTITLGGTAQATGGAVGDHITLIDMGANEWHVRGHIANGGTEATPFSTV